MTKTCSKCKVEKDSSCFHKSKAQPDGLANWCKTCVSQLNKQRTKEGHWSKHYAKYRDKQLAGKKTYYQEHREAKLAYQKERRKNPEVKLRHNLDKTSKKTGYSKDVLIEFYTAQFAKQDGCCAICGRHQSEFGKRFDIDHDHKTNELRGLLCSGCNLGIGNLRDDAEVCLKAYMYLRKAKVGNVGTERSSKAPKYDEEIT